MKTLKRHKLCDLEDVPPREIQEPLKNLIDYPNHDKEEVCAMADHRKCEEVKDTLDDQPGSHKLYMDRSRRLRSIYSLWLPGWSL
ncbi:hypothetical protein DPMN_113191 [Dreissena polymorpha]|uniref:Uncharacterized protein n=1 Tax=Dreissena polymorpha TaxID=45954 RepID=A0A9D4KHR5_DREPO|nr:hypothetical protein DPMN_113191 [Dreissena polymorpha]